MYLRRTMKAELEPHPSGAAIDAVLSANSCLRLMKRSSLHERVSWTWRALGLLLLFTLSSWWLGLGIQSFLLAIVAFVLFRVFGLYFLPLSRSFWHGNTGSMTITREGLELKDKGTVEHIALSEITAACLIYDYVRGERFHMKDIDHTGEAVLRLEMAGGRERCIAFIIDRMEQFGLVRELLRAMYDRRIEVTEFMGIARQPTLLLNRDLSFEERQLLKSELRSRSLH